MKCNSFKILISLCTIALLSGCNPDLKKSVKDTDKAVYDIIDKSWQANQSDSSADYNLSNKSDIPAIFDAEILPLNTAVALATTNNREYQTIKENIYLTALDQVEIEHIYDGTWFVGAKSGIEKNEDGKGNGTAGSIGIEKLLATGAKISSNISLGCMDILSGDLKSGMSTVISTMISQPLLRGAGRKIALENLTQAERNTLYEIRNFNHYRKDFVTNIIIDYYNLLLLNNLQINASEYCNKMEQIYKNLQVRARIGRVASFEMEQANQDKIQAISEYMTAKRLYEDELDEFKKKLYIPLNQEFTPDTAELDILTSSISAPLQLGEDKSIELAILQRLDLMNAADQSDDAERKVEVASDSIRAELNLVGYASSETPNRSVFGASPAQLRASQEQYSLALELDLPFDRVAEKSNYRRALIDVIRTQRQQQEITETIILEVRKDFRKLQESSQKYNNENSALTLAQKRSDNTISLLGYGRAKTRDVLDAQKDLYRAKNSSTTAMVEYAIANLQLMKDTGIIKIKEDGQWENSLNMVLSETN